MHRRVRIGVSLAAAAAALAVTAPAASEEPPVYVALGDSFTSGPLVLPHDSSRVPEDCGQSARNYPHLVAQRMGLELRDVSCGGATIDDFSEPQDLPAGGVNPPQFGALGPDADIVTVGISGNDIGFVGFVIDCGRLVGPPVEQPCTPEYTAGGRDRMSERIAATAGELGAALDEIHRLAPNAEVFVVNYPSALPDDGHACWPYVPILPDDMPYIVAKYKEMNAMLAEQAALHDATYVDIYTPSIGHDACQPPPFAWVNGIVVVPPSFPAHPNEFGLAAAADVLERVLRARGG